MLSMDIRSRVLPTALVLTVSLVTVARAQHPGMPPGTTHDEHLKQMQKEADLKKRGSAAMGFDQQVTTHHFRMTADGGRINVTVNDPSDAENLAQIRSHLREIAAAFANGDFSKAFATHGEVPPGVLTLQELRGAIQYAYEEVRDGGRVVMTTSDPRALAAAHEFLRYQIREHQTGDPLSVGKQ